MYLTPKENRVAKNLRSLGSDAMTMKSLLR